MSVQAPVERGDTVGRFSGVVSDYVKYDAVHRYDAELSGEDKRNVGLILRALVVMQVPALLSGGGV